MKAAFLLTTLLLLTPPSISQEVDRFTRIGLFLSRPSTPQISPEVKESLDSPKEYSASGLNEDVLRRIFARIQESLSMYPDGQVVQHAALRLSENSVILKKKNPKRGHKIDQAISGDLYLVDGNDAALQLPYGSPKYVEGDVIITASVRSGVYEYTTVMGAHRRINKYKVVELSDPGYSDFKKALDDGAQFFFTMPMAVSCPRCLGERFYEFEDPEKEYKTVRKLCTVCPGSRGKIQTELGFMLTK